MAYKRRATRSVQLDANHEQIVTHLIRLGFEVIVTLEPVDCLVYNKEIQRAGWIEIKTKARNTNIKRSQIEFLAKTEMPACFAMTAEDAAEFARTMNGLTQKEKDNLGIFLLDTEDTKDKKNAYHPAVIERVLKW